MSNVSDEEMQEHYDNFFEDVFVECEDKVISLIFFSLLPGTERLVDNSNLSCRHIFTSQAPLSPKNVPSSVPIDQFREQDFSMFTHLAFFELASLFLFTFFSL